MTPLVEKALVFATAAHAAVGQTRKYTGEPYISHPIRVMQLVAIHVDDATPEMLAAALLHDVVEDTKVNFATILMHFGDDVAKLVAELTKVSKPEDGNRETRKALDKAFLAKASNEAKTIKLADIIHNLSDIESAEEGFAWKFLKEKESVLDVLSEGDITLYVMALEAVSKAKNVLHTKQMIQSDC